MKIKQSLLTIIFIVSTLSGCTLSLNQPSGRSTPGSTPLPWAKLNLHGKLIYTTAQQDGTALSMDIRLLDLATGATHVLFHAPPAGIIYSVTVSPNASQLIFAYAPPPGPNQSIYQALYQMPLDASKSPQLFLPPPTPDDQYMQPAWSPDGRYIYFAHVNYQRPPQKGQQYPFYELYRISYPTGPLEKLAEQAYWPRLAPDMSHMAYITLDPMTGKNQLILANVDGGNPLALKLTGDASFDILDAPLFSPDGASLLFSVPVPEKSYQPAPATWIEKILGIDIASAHAIPSDWWSVRLTGGAATQLTQLQAIGLFGSISPDKKQIASYSGNGIFVMNPDGSSLTMLISDVGGLPGTVSWIP